jgi:hypothetical protein
MRSLIAIAILLASAGSAHALVIEYTNETDYLTALAGFSFGSFQETFDNDAVWGTVRSPNTAPSILSLGITWSANNSNSGVSTTSGAALSGWGFFSSPHGDYASGTGCDVAGACGDGFTGTSATPLFGVGGWISGTAGASIEFILDGDDANPIGFDGAPAFSGTSNFLFFGVIDDTNGFTQFEVREMEGTPGDQELIWADDFTMAVPEPGTLPLLGAAMMSLAFLRRRRLPL